MDQTKLLENVVHGIGGNSVNVNFVMEMGACRRACRTHGSDFLTSLNDITLRNKQARIVPVERSDPVSVI